MDKEPWLIGPSKAHYLNLEQWSTPLKTDHFQEKSFVSEDNFDEDLWLCWCCNDVLMSRGGAGSLENIKHVWWHSEIMIRGQRSMLSLRSLTTTFALSSVIQRWFASWHNVSLPSKPRHWHRPLLSGRQWLDRQSENGFHRPNEIVLMIRTRTWVWSVVLNEGGANLPLPACHKSALVPRTIWNP